ncbi:hypothetical protein ACWEOE_28980 [Amycolatopsis sp. NPDC004368]
MDDTRETLTLDRHLAYGVAWLIADHTLITLKDWTGWQPFSLLAGLALVVSITYMASAVRRTRA